MKVKITEEEKNERNSQKKEVVYENIKKLADVWAHIDKKEKKQYIKKA